MTKYFLLTAGLCAILMMPVISCNRSKEKEQEKTEVVPEDIVELRSDQEKLADIKTGFVEQRSMSGLLKVNGKVTVSPQDLATVCAPMGGFIKSTSFIPGNAVRKGQILAIIENQEFIDIQQNYLEAKNKFDYAEAEYKRHSDLYKQDVYSQKNLQQVTTEFKNLKAQVKALEQKLALIGINASGLREDNISRSVTVLSPISGYIRTVNINIGKYVNPSDVLFEIVNGDKLLLELDLFEKDADKVTAGQKIRFFINNEKEQHEAVIYQTGKSINPDKTLKVYATVITTCKNVIPGMYVNAMIESGSDQVLAVPSDAVVNFEDKDYIFVFSRKKTESGKLFSEYRMIQVQKGIEDDGYTEINFPDGMNAKTLRIIVKGAYTLLSAKKNAGEMAC
ncbi:MAG: efflux RND transporter periplasmic adaptor subunit [Bacteroidota bacterium]|nr:efflux RND transporter periplasmic adaptor subunit [Bacteroidota bacterium]